MKNASLLAALAAARRRTRPAGDGPRAARRSGARTVKRVPTPPRWRACSAGITDHRDETWRWQRVMQRPRRRTPTSARSVAQRRLPASGCCTSGSSAPRKAKRQALNPPHKAQWLCIHHYEGSWTDPNAPYYGGLQMDRRVPGRPTAATLLRAKGTADHWTPLEQMWVAERAYQDARFLAVAEHGQILRTCSSHRGSEVTLGSTGSALWWRACMDRLTALIDQAEEHGLRQPLAVQRARAGARARRGRARARLRGARRARDRAHRRLRARVKDDDTVFVNGDLATTRPPTRSSSS